MPLFIGACMVIIAIIIIIIWPLLSKIGSAIENHFKDKAESKDEIELEEANQKENN